MALGFAYESYWCRLTELAGLKTLELRNTKVTDAALKELVGLKGLQYLDLSRTTVTDEG